MHIKRSTPGADDCWNDYWLSISRLQIKIPRIHKKKLKNKNRSSMPEGRFYCTYLPNLQTSEDFKEPVARKFAELWESSHVEDY